MLTTIAASIGFTFAVTTFIAGFRMVRILEKEAESMLHRVNGYLTFWTFCIVAFMSLLGSPSISSALLWLCGMTLHLFKIFLVKKKQAVRYGGYLGGLILLSWGAVIVLHLPA